MSMTWEELVAKTKEFTPEQMKGKVTLWLDKGSDKIQGCYGGIESISMRNKGMDIEFPGIILEADYIEGREKDWNSNEEGFGG